MSDLLNGDRILFVFRVCKMSDFFPFIIESDVIHLSLMEIQLHGFAMSFLVCFLVCFFFFPF